jgi:uncharacterized protein RhaS with RHS repeats
MGVRTYVPQLGRFLQPDPVQGGSFNDYDYAFQDPASVTDLDGACPFCRALPSIARAVGRGAKAAGRGVVKASRYAARQASKAYKYAKSVRVKIGIHQHAGGPHQHVHFQINWWRKGVRRSGHVWRFPEKPFRFPGRR